MDDKELKLAQDEFRTTRDTLVDLLLQRMFEFENRENRIIERKHTSIVAFSSLEIAMVAIVFPIYASNEALGCLSIVSVVLLLVGAIYGIGLIIFSNIKEGTLSKVQNDAEQKFLAEQLKEVVQIYSQAIDGMLEEKHIEDYLNMKEESKKIYTEDVKPVTKYSSVLDKLYYLFLGIFGLGLLLFVLSIFGILT
ncbi:MAG: hypothetical protein HYW95_01890 [Candidatus Wildermuthbacteria bacterium]|nr:hypothetical protein [Candidatus Wildermuthbacteria bacterium]